MKHADGTWEHLDYESTLLDEGFEGPVEEFILDSVAYYEKQKMLELMYDADYFSQRNIAKSHNGTWYVRKVKTGENS